MPEKTTGVLLRSEDGHNYFIPEKVLEAYNVSAEEVNDDHILDHAPHMKAWPAEQADDGRAPIVAMMTH